MLTTEEAFAKFRTRLELTQREQENASERQREIRAHMEESFHVEHDFLTGSYARHTKTKPLKDVDIFCVLGEGDRHYRDKKPGVLLSAVEEALANTYGTSAVKRQRRSVTIDFGIEVKEDFSEEKVVSFDVVPAFAFDDHYEIPDTATSDGWTETNPRVHAEKAVEAHEAFDGEWKGLVRMVKYWNNTHRKPIRPSFLIEVIALEVLHPPYGGRRDREIQSFFATLADRIFDTWEDPAGLGPPVSDMMDETQKRAAAVALKAAEREAAQAIHLGRVGQQGDALRAWRQLFGPLFPVS